MKLKPKQLPWLALGAGGLGAALRLLFSDLGTDDRGLLPAAHPTLILLYCLIILVPVLLVWGIWDMKDTPPYKKLFPASKLSFAGSVLGFAGIAYNILSSATSAANVMAILAVILGALAASCLLLLGYLRQRSLRPHYCFHSVVTIYLTFQLVAFYQSWNTQPQLQQYLPQMLALVFLMLSSYQRATLDAGTGKRRDFTFCNLGAVFFCCVAAVGDRWPFFLGMAAWCFTNQCSLAHDTSPVAMKLPEEVLYCIETLENAGYSAYAVGGCVRDHLLGLTPSDYDLCTNAKPERICELFSQHELVRNGEKHGTIGVVLSGQLYEITTFRTEGGYADTRHPDWVEFVEDVNQDLARRDFTVNAMAYSPAAGFVDPFGGQRDLAAKVLRAVGKPEVRFTEDALRILRGVRFSVRFDLKPEEKTLEAMVHCAPLMEQLAWERISSELCKLLPLISTEQLLRYRDIITQVFPELASGEEQDLYTPAAQVAGQTPQDLPVRMAALLHGLGEETAEAVLLRLRISNALRNRTLQLIRLLGTPLTGDKKLLRHLAGIEGDEALMQAIALQKAVTIAADHDTTDLDTAALLLQTIGQDGSCLSVKDLAISGFDLLSLGAEPGPHIGKCMQSLLSLVQEDLLANTKEELMAAAKTFLEL